jgi:predicted MFS family arabinose efflux permease
MRAAETTVESRDVTGAVEPGAATIPPWVYLLSATIFVITTAEFMVAGLMPSLATAFAVSVGEIGNLIALFALGMTFGGPLVIALLLRLGVSNKDALLWLLGVFLTGSTLAAMAPSYAVMALARTLQGVTSAACFGIGLTLCAESVRADLRGRAASLVLAGLMIAPVVGVPAAALINDLFGWRSSFWLIVGLTALCIAIVGPTIPRPARGTQVDLASGLAELRNTRLWAAYATSGLIIGATFAAFSYVTAIFTAVTGLAPRLIPIVLAAYGVATVIGNLIVGRLADRHTIPVLAIGLVVLAAALASFAAVPTDAAVSVAAFLVIGLTGVSLNPAMVARVMRVAHPGPLVNSLHTSVITGGLAFGTWLGGLAIDRGYGLAAPLWIGAGLAVLGLLSLAPRRARDLTA